MTSGKSSTGIRSREASECAAPDIRIIDADCPLCGAHDSSCILDGLRDVEDGVHGEYAISRCAHCSLVYLSRRPAQESVGLCYNANYHVQDPRRRKSVLKFLYDLRLHYRYRRLLAATGARCNALLEIGCGDGSFLRHLDERLDPSVRLMGIDFQVLPHDSGRLRIIQGDFDSLTPHERFDVVIMINVLEHVFDPLGSLRAIGRLLDDGGMVYGEVPNWRSPWRRIFPKHWQGLQIPRHMSHFEPVTLQRTLEAAGFETTWIRGVYDPGDLAVTLCAWVTDVLRLRTPPRQAWFYGLAIVLSGPVVWLANLSGFASGSIEFCARKR